MNRKLPPAEEERKSGLEERYQKAHLVMDEVRKSIVGKDDCIEKVMAAILAGGNVLLEDVPGVGKTEMAIAFSRACGLKSNRVQFTPDVMPADITGFSMYRKETESFVYRPGAVMCNLLLADEINRTSPKTQSALLEVMEEGNVTIDGVTRPVPRPFIVLATQNPVGSFGTQRLPEAQMDRFLICITMGYPELEDEIAMLKSRHRGRPLDRIVPVINGEELLMMQAETENIFIHDALYKYMTLLSRATRENECTDLGLSPRGTLALGKMARAYAYIRGRNYCVPKDIKAALYDVGMHRIRLNQRARINGRKVTDILDETLSQVREPRLGERV
ncbi:AAA family ATPase [Acetatifactor muris]|uniref:AAA family ATPase n=1 Tax=Acetatifactor muris TaxID=879566 RepID=UPI0023F25120|nr:MoxR family ATPase [Acetatifactor muris]